MFAGSSILAIESDRNALRGVEIQYTRIVNAVESNERARIKRARILLKVVQNGHDTQVKMTF